ncbi:MAG: DUF485 domain-containing protein [Pseudonocardiales bacterium]|nr:DUF485 domain-containing protein [Pseudonocardiales bacterium]
MSTTEPVGGVGRRSVVGVGNRPVGGTDSRPLVDPWAAAHTSTEFAVLRNRLRGFVFPMTTFFLAWYFLYVLLAAFAPHFMAIRIVGNINVGLVFGLLQFVTTFAIATIYVRFANRHLDPVGSRIREQVEGGTW